jgi:hypothetical protein
MIPVSNDSIAERFRALDNKDISTVNLIKVKDFNRIWRQAYITDT